MAVLNTDDEAGSSIVAEETEDEGVGYRYLGPRSYLQASTSIVAVVNFGHE